MDYQAINIDPELLPDMAKILIVLGAKMQLDIRYSYGPRIIRDISVPGYLIWIHGSTNHLWIEQEIMNQTSSDDIQFTANWFTDNLWHLGRPQPAVSINHPKNKVLP